MRDTLNDKFPEVLGLPADSFLCRHNRGTLSRTLSPRESPDALFESTGKTIDIEKKCSISQAAWNGTLLSLFLYLQDARGILCILSYKGRVKGSKEPFKK